MSRWLLLCLTLWVACGRPSATGDEEAASSPIPDQDLLLRVTAGAEQVDFGVAFPLTVVRIWSVDLDPEPWNDQALAPLVVRLVDVTRREDGEHIEETWRYEGYAFSRAGVTVPAVMIQATDAGSVRTASSEAITLRVTSALGEEEPGPAELPRGPFPAPFPWLRWSSVGAAFLASLGLMMWYSRWRVHLPAAAPTRPHQRALQMLQQLRGVRPDGSEEVKAYCIEASSLLRRYIEDRFSVSVFGMTTEEFLVAPRVLAELQDHHRRILATFLELCDLVKFARHVPSQGDLTQLLSAAESFVRETCSDEEDPSRVGGAP